VQKTSITRTWECDLCGAASETELAHLYVRGSVVFGVFGGCGHSVIDICGECLQRPAAQVVAYSERRTKPEPRADRTLTLGSMQPDVS
jgi:hypothetical protein